jgi:hypothetical protein
MGKEHKSEKISSMPRTDEKYIEHGKFVKPKTNILQKFGKISRGADEARKPSTLKKVPSPLPPSKIKRSMTVPKVLVYKYYFMATARGKF